MDDTIINNINKVVKEDDTLRIVGDFSMSRDFNIIANYRRRIKCQNVHLILGNHDYLTENEYNNIFEKVSTREFFKYNGQYVVADHYSGRVWDKSHKGSWLLWGHSHGELSDYGLSFDVGVDCWNFKPLSMEDVAKEMKKKVKNHIVK